MNGQIFAQFFPQGNGEANCCITFGDGCEGDDDAVERQLRLASRLDLRERIAGNADTAYAYQYIVVLDTIAPQFTNTCDIDNGETVEYACTSDDNQNGISDIFDFVQIPDACGVLFADNCDSDAMLDFTSLESGYLPEEVANHCMPSDPEPTRGWRNLR